MSSSNQNKILVVDDLDSELLAAMLTRLGGYSVDRAENAQLALSLAMTIDYDVILLDGSMPEMDGFTLARVLKGRGIRAPLIFVTAHLNEVTRPHALAVGACDVIEKPVEVDELLESVRRALADDCDADYPAPKPK